MEQEMRTIIESIKQEVLSQIGGMRAANKVVPVSGTRHVLPLEGRDIDMVYYPAEREHAPLLIGFHGGGFLFGGCALDDAMWDAMRNALNVNIASIDYRKTPDYMYPCALEDAYDATVYLRDHADEFGFDKEHISVFGNSAGATLAATVCIYAKEKGEVLYDYQILNYPSVDWATNYAEKGPGSLDGPINAVFNELYIKPEDAKKITASPIFATREELTGLPAAIIRTAEIDSLRAEGEQYAKMLQDAGVPVYLSNAAGMPHGYYEYGFGDAAPADYLGEELKKLILDGTMHRGAAEALEFIRKYYK